MTSCQLWGWRDGLEHPVILTTGTRTRCAYEAPSWRAHGWHCTVYPTGGVPDVLALVGITPQRRLITILIRRESGT